MSRRLLDKLPKMMEGPEFAAAWEETREDFSIARKIIRTRVAAGMSQKELAAHRKRLEPRNDRKRNR